jgi:uncharacterized protein
MTSTLRSTEVPAIEGSSTRRQRSQTMDVVRGLAVSGMLLANITFFASPLSIVMTHYWRDPADRIASLFVTFFLAGKGYSIFSLLFGLGCAMYIQRARESTAGLAFYLRRMGALLIIGLLHAVFLSAADILHTYALLGVVLLLFTRFSNRALLTAAAVCIALPMVISAGQAIYAQAQAQTQAQTQSQSQARTPAQQGAGASASSTDASQTAVAAYFARITAAARIYRRGSFFEIAALRTEEFKRRFLPTLVSAPHILGMMLLGVYVYRRRIFDDIAAHRALLWRVMAWTLPIGLLLNGFVLYASETVSAELTSALIAVVADSAFHIGATAFALLYVAAAMLFFAPRPQSRLAIWFAAVGRLALSNYIAQSIVCSVLFLSYGFGLYGYYGPGKVTFWAVGISAALMVLSVWWTRRFQYGPLEWVWRTASYGRRQAFRVRVVAPA